MTGLERPIATRPGAGDRLYLRHGPIDLIVAADGPGDARTRAFAAAEARFVTILGGLVADLAGHRARLALDAAVPPDPVAARMYRAARPYCAAEFVTPMVAVAGAVADEMLAAMRAATPLRRAYVNNGGDIAAHLAPGETYAALMAAPDGTRLGRIRFAAADGIGGLATSGAGGRSHSLGIAESVTVLAASAAAADVAATLIANAVDLPDHPGIGRAPARDLQPDSDLGARRVVTHVPPLGAGDARAALARGARRARALSDARLIAGAALFLQGQAEIVGAGFEGDARSPRVEHA
jgi:ApbE superfamily uncharacterized protein (UPF0280 family)